MLWRQFVSGHFSVKIICQCLCFSEDNCPVLWRQLGSAHFRGDNCPLIWRQFGSALFSVKTIFQCFIFLHFSPFLVKTIVLLLYILWRQLYYCYLFCEDNCTSAHEDNCPLVWRQLSTALKTIVNCSFIEKTILLVKTIVPLSAFLYEEIRYALIDAIRNKVD